MQTPLVIAIVIGPADTISQARQHSSDFLVSEGCSLSSNPPEAMLPTAISANGNTPASHYACTTVWNAEQFQRCLAYIDAKQMLVEGVILANHGGDKNEQKQLEAEYLTSRGLKVVA